MPDPFKFDDYREVVRAWLREDARRSLRTAARQMRCSPSLLHAIAHTDPERQRGMGAQIVKNFCAAAGFDPEQERGFTLMVAMEHGLTWLERRQAEAQLVALRRFREARALGTEQGSFLTAWYLPVIFELARCGGFHADPAWIAGALVPPLDEATAKEALERLLTLGLLRRDAEGRLVPVPDVRLDYESSEAREALAAWHRWLCIRGASAIDAFTREERFFNAITIAIPSAMVPEISELIVNLLQDVLARSGMAAERDRVYQLNVQLFPVTVGQASG